MKIFMSGLLFLAFVFVLMLLGTGMNWWGLWFQRYSMPFQEETRRQTYTNSMTYQQGSVTNMSDLCLQFHLAKDQQSKDLLASVIRQRKSVYVGPELPPDILACVSEAGD